jgi:ATPase family protein associated with various cellular activities (AAA)
MIGSLFGSARKTYLAASQHRLRASLMGIENFIKDALYKPNDYIAYHVGRELAELHPGKAIIEGKTGYFDLEAYVRAEKCSIVEESSVFNHIKTEWERPGKNPTKQLENSWLNVLWSGQLLDVVLITFAENCYRSRHHWIVAESRKLAEAFFAEVCEWSSEVRGEILVFQDGYWEKNKELYVAIKTATFDNLILPDSLKQQVQNDFEQFFRSREVYEQYRIPWKRGALFIGPPGNGKTHTVKALINQLGRPCLYVKGFKSEYATEQENMGAAFARARMTTPCLMVFEDIDAMIDDENRSFFLNELDGFDSNIGLGVLATTNHADRLDPAILDRPSRFDRKYYFNLPAAAERFAYVAAWNKQLQPELRLSERTAGEVVQQTANFSFAYMKELFVSATMQWMSTRSEIPDSTSGEVSANGAPQAIASMEEIILDQAARLRAQMATLSVSPASAQLPLSARGTVARILAIARRFLRTLHH